MTVRFRAGARPASGTEDWRLTPAQSLLLAAGPRRALDAEGKDADARKAGRSAVKHLNDALGPNNAETLAARQFAAASK